MRIVNKDQTPAAGSKAAVRRIIEGMRRGQPNYALMSADLAATTRQQLPQLKSLLERLGAIQSISFKGVGPGGADIYEIKFENGSLEYRIWLGLDAKVENTNVR